MKTKLVIITVIVLSILSCNTSDKKEAKTEFKTESLKLMTYNIRLNTESDSSNAWPNRKDFLSSQVLFIAPDIMGVQEALPNQIEDLKLALPNYNHIGVGRDGGNNGEYSAIYYNTKNLDVIESNTFWLSETPTEIAPGWDAALPRICTYGLFTTKSSNKKFWVFNTHFDHVGALARKESMKLILSKIKTINTQNYPALIMGDFNAEPNSDVITVTKEMMDDSRDLAKIKFGPNGTFNGFNYDEPATRRIDYILLSKSSNLKVNKYAVFSSAIDSKFPSDHFPVFIELEYK